MAFASVGARGTNNLKVAGTVLTVQPNTTIPVGALLAVFVAWDNNNNATLDGPVSRQMSCEDDAGNIYTTVYGGQDTGVSSGVSQRAMGFIFLSRLREELTTSNTITLNHFNTAAPKPAKAVSLWEFSMAEDKVWAVAGDQGPSQILTRALDPASISLSGLDSQEYLLLHILAAEAPSTDTYTWDADYTQITTDGTTGGAADSNIQVNGGFRIATLTGDTVDVTSDTADRDYTQGLLAVCEVEPASDFPTSPILDDFNRADESPLDGGLWNTDPNCFAGSSSSERGRVVSNQAARTSALGTEGAGQWFLEEDFSECQELYVSIPTAITGDVRSFVGLTIRGGGCRQNTTLFGYQSVWEKADASNQLTAKDNIRLGKLQSAAVLAHEIITHIDLEDGAKLGVQVDDQIVHQWVNVGGEWFETGAIYYTIPSRHPVDVVEGGLRALVFNGGSIRADDFGGGGCAPFTIISMNWRSTDQDIISHRVLIGDKTVPLSDL